MAQAEGMLLEAEITRHVSVMEDQMEALKEEILEKLKIRKAL